MKSNWTAESHKWNIYTQSLNREKQARIKKKSSKHTTNVRIDHNVTLHSAVWMVCDVGWRRYACRRRIAFAHTHLACLFFFLCRSILSLSLSLSFYYTFVIICISLRFSVVVVVTACQGLTTTRQALKHSIAEFLFSVANRTNCNSFRFFPHIHVRDYYYYYYF